MNLYLSSYRLGSHPEVLQELSGPNKKAAVIANATDYKSADERRIGLDREVQDLESLGFIPEELDLRLYFDKPNLLSEKIEEYGLVWARGGNAYLLRQAMARSGFDETLKIKLNSDPNFVYGGYSAGIVVLAPTMEGLDIVDDIHVRAEGYKNELIFTGLGILKYSVIPHYKSDHPESPAIDEVVEYLDQHKIIYKTLRDGEVIVIRGSTVSLIK